MELDKSLNQSPQGGLENIGYMSSNEPLGNCYKVPNKYLIGHVLGGQNGGSTEILDRRMKSEFNRKTKIVRSS